MTYYGSKEMAASFRTVRANTLKIAREIPEDQYDFRPAPDTRTIGATLTHIAFGTRFHRHLYGNTVTELAQLNLLELTQQAIADEGIVRTKGDMITCLTEEGRSFASFLEDLTDSFLAEHVTMLPGVEPRLKSRFEGLLAAKEHEMHHRGQLMTMQRMIGIVPHLTRHIQERRAAIRAGAGRWTATEA